jgi:hypothetical protein
MGKVFTKSFLTKLKKSKTMLFNMLLAFIGILEYNLHLFYDVLGEHYGIVFVIIATVGAYLRMITTESIEDKE